MHFNRVLSMSLSLLLLSFHPLFAQSPKKEEQPNPQKRQVRPPGQTFSFEQLKAKIVERMRALQAEPPQDTLAFEEAAGKFFCSCACGMILGKCLCEIKSAGKEQRGFLRALLDLGMQMKDIESVMTSLYGPEIFITQEDEDFEELDASN